MRIGIYNRYWSTFGGGEQQAGGIADALSAEHDVELLGPVTLDLDLARERLGLRLAGVTFREVAGDEYAATLASADYDVFVNHTYRSIAPNLAPIGIYFVMFPHQFEQDALRREVRRVAARAASPVRVLNGVSGRRTGAVALQAPALVQARKGVRTLSLVFDAAEPDDLYSVAVAPGAKVTHRRVEGRVEMSFDLPAGHANEVLVTPSLDGEPRVGDTNLQLREIRADGVRIATDPLSVRQRLAVADHTTFLATYRSVVALSEYTRKWSQIWWGRGDAVVSPPVALRSAGPKEQVIVSIGRFFDEHSGHSKRQVELVDAFRRLVEGGLTGWRLVLIGGCNPENRDYAMAVRSAARGLPIEVRLNAPGSFVDSSLAAATIFWHAAGLGSDLDAHPDRAEHFGIAPIEAMSAGAVPVVFAAAGPAEVVQDGVNGLHFRTVDELVQQTRRLVDDPELREALARAAVARAQEYDRAHFETTVRALVASLAAEAVG